MEYQHLGNIYVIENGIIKMLNKKNQLQQLIVIKHIAWIWNHLGLKRFEIHTSGGDPVPVFYPDFETAEKILIEINKYI